VEWVVIDAVLADPAAGAAQPVESPCAADAATPTVHAASGGVFGADMGGAGPCDEVNVARAAQELDAAVKALFDPAGLYPHPGQSLQP
jgi:hypothetical protein